MYVLRSKDSKTSRSGFMLLCEYDRTTTATSIIPQLAFPRSVCQISKPTMIRPSSLLDPWPMPSSSFVHPCPVPCLAPQKGCPSPFSPPYLKSPNHVPFSSSFRNPVPSDTSVRDTTDTNMHTPPHLQGNIPPSPSTPPLPSLPSSQPSH